MSTRLAVATSGGGEQLPRGCGLFSPLPFDMARKKIKGIDLIRLLILTQYGKCVGNRFGVATYQTHLFVERNEVFTVWSGTDALWRVAGGTPHLCWERLWQAFGRASVVALDNSTPASPGLSPTMLMIFWDLVRSGEGETVSPARGRTVPYMHAGFRKWYCTAHGQTSLNGTSSKSGAGGVRFVIRRFSARMPTVRQLPRS